MADILSIRKPDNHFQRAEALRRSREKRRQYGLFFVEGVSSINLALESGWEFNTLLYSRDGKLSEWAEAIIRNSSAQQHLVLAPDLLAALSEKEQPSEILALVKMRNPQLCDFHPEPNRPILLCDRPSSPGNLGSSLRACDAFGAQALIISGHAIDPYDPKVIHASVGTFFVIPVFQIPGPSEFALWRSTLPNHWEVIGTSATASQSISEYKACDALQAPIILFGNETHGLSRAYKDIAAKQLYKIPMQGAASSLNVSQAVAICLYELSH